jgi:hypothetical protein
MGLELVEGAMEADGAVVSDAAFLLEEKRQCPT